jgi:hypothetical protein
VIHTLGAVKILSSRVEAVKAQEFRFFAVDIAPNLDTDSLIRIGSTRSS